MREKKEAKGLEQRAESMTPSIWEELKRREVMRVAIILAWPFKLTIDGITTANNPSDADHLPVDWSIHHDRYLYEE